MKEDRGVQVQPTHIPAPRTYVSRVWSVNCVLIVLDFRGPAEKGARHVCNAGCQAGYRASADDKADREASAHAGTLYVCMQVRSASPLHPPQRPSHASWQGALQSIWRSLSSPNRRGCQSCILGGLPRYNKRKFCGRCRKKRASRRILERRARPSVLGPSGLWS